MNKKALSAIVATVALVLLTFAAIVIVLNFVVPFVKDNLETGSECFPYRDYFIFTDEYGYNCYTGNPVARDATYFISLRAKTISDEESAKVFGFKLSFIKDGGSNVVIEINNGATIPGLSMLSGPQPENLVIPQSGEVRSYKYEIEEEFNYVEVLPKLDNGRVCDKSDSIKFERACG